MDTTAKAILHHDAMRETRAAMRGILGGRYQWRVAGAKKLLRNHMALGNLSPESALEQIINILDATGAEVNQVTLGLLVSAAVEIGWPEPGALSSPAPVEEIDQVDHRSGLVWVLRHCNVDQDCFDTALHHFDLGVIQARHQGGQEMVQSMLDRCSQDTEAKG
jgi:hypothetical protein